MKQVPFGPVRFDILQLKRKDRATINSIEELQEELDNTLTSVSGNPITLSDSSNTNAEGLTATISPTQASGTPTPSNPLEISGVSTLKLKRNSKNLLPYPYTQGSTTASGITYSMNSDGSIGISGTCTNTHQIVLVSASGDWLPSGSYTFTLKNTGLYGIDVQARNSGTYVRSLLGIGEYADKTGEFEFEVDYSGYNQISIVLLITAQRTVNTTIYPMIRESSFTDNTYEPYQGTTLSLSLGSTVYGGSVDATAGVLTENRKMYEFEGGSDESWSVDGPNSSDLYEFSIAHSGDISTTNAICNMLELQSTAFSDTTTEGFHIDSTNIYLRLASSKASTVAELKTWLASNNIQVCGVLSTPTTTQLTATNLRLLQGNNTIWSNGDTLSFSYQPNNLIGELKAWVLDQLS